MTGGNGDNEARVALMRITSSATDAELEASLDALAPLPPMTELRPPEIGLAMLRGRIGGDGAAFNVGEATVTRAAVRLETGEVGIAYLLGRRTKAAFAAARIDALGQVPEWRSRLADSLTAPVSRRIEREQAAAVAKTAATRVDFFTLVRGDDET